MQKRLVPIFLFLFSFSVFAAETASEKDVLVNDILEASSIKIALASIPNQMAQLPGMLPPPEGVEAADFQAFLKTFMSEIFTQFNEAEALNAVTDHFVKNGEAEHLSAILQWLTSETGRAITNQEILMQTSDMSGLMQHMQSFKADQLPAERKAILVEYINALDITRTMTDSMTKILPTMIREIGVAMGEDVVVLENKIKQISTIMEQQMAAQMQKMEQQMQQQMLASLSYFYKDFSDADLKAYSGFVNSPAGQHYLRLTMDSTMEYAMEWVAELLPKIIVSAAEAKKNQ